MQSVGASGSAYTKALTTAKIGFYNNASATRVLVFIGFTSAGNPQIAPFFKSPATGIDEFLLGGGVSSANVVPAGTLGGTMKCGERASSVGGHDAVCVWMDSSTLGMLLEPGGTAAQLAPVALSFRNRAEH
jgi:hypothetical protein